MQTWRDPLQHFESWYGEAQQLGDFDCAAMVLATASRAAVPSARVVYFKGLCAGAFSFYTNYRSRKGEELAANVHAALLFYWSPLARQVRIEGTVHKLSREVSTRYFTSRPLARQISAVISPQSEVIPSHQSLREKFAQAQRKYARHTELPCPPHWGGYALQPQRCEFFVAHDNRLNERVLYEQQMDDKWHIKYLAP